MDSDLAMRTKKGTSCCSCDNLRCAPKKELSSFYEIYSPAPKKEQPVVYQYSAKCARKGTCLRRE